MNIKLNLFLFLITISTNAYSVLSQTYASEQIAYQECVIDRDSTNGNTQNSGNGGATCTQLLNLAPSYSHTYDHVHYSPPRQTYKHYFYNTSCPANEPLNTSTGLCTAVQSSCNSGTSRSFSYNVKNANSELRICIGSCTETVSHNGCDVSFQVDYNDCVDVLSGADTGAIQCNVTGTETGNSSSSTSSVQPTTETTEQLESGCLKGIKDNSPITICVSDSAVGAGKIGGTPVVMSSSVPTDCVRMKLAGGSYGDVCAGGQKNCGLGSDGTYSCFDKLVPTLNTVCISSPTSPDCLALTGQDSVKTDSSTSIVTNQDGSTTTTVTETSNVFNNSDSSTVTTNFTDGSSTSTTNGESNQTTESNSLNKETNKILKDINKEQTTTNSLLTDIVGESSDFDTSTFSSDLSNMSDSSSNDLLSSFNNFVNPYTSFNFTSITDWLPSLPSSSCAGSINTTIFGRPFILDPCLKLQPLREILSWVFSLMAIFSVIRTVFFINQTS